MTQFSNISEQIQEMMNLGDIYTCSCHPPLAFLKTVDTKLKKVTEKNDKLIHCLLEERFKLEYMKRLLVNDDTDEIEMEVPSYIWRESAGYTDFFDPDAFDFSAWHMINSRDEDLTRYFKGKVPEIFSYITSRIEDYDEYWENENEMNNYILQSWSMRVQKSCVGDAWYLELKMNFKEEEFVECCITQEDIPKRDAYYNGEVYMSEDAYNDFRKD
jgi:hypothetical protein